MVTFEAGFKLLIFCTGEVWERPGSLCQVIILFIIGIGIAAHRYRTGNIKFYFL